jgi:hypothetical protein
MIQKGRARRRDFPPYTNVQKKEREKKKKKKKKGWLLVGFLRVLAPAAATLVPRQQQLVF